MGTGCYDAAPRSGDNPNRPKLESFALEVALHSENLRGNLGVRADDINEFTVSIPERSNAPLGSRSRPTLLAIGDIFLAAISQSPRVKDLKQIRETVHINRNRAISVLPQGPIIITGNLCARLFRGQYSSPLSSY